MSAAAAGPGHPFPASAIATLCTFCWVNSRRQVSMTIVSPVAQWCPDCGNLHRFEAPYDLAWGKKKPSAAEVDARFPRDLVCGCGHTQGVHHHRKDACELCRSQGQTPACETFGKAAP